MTIDKRLEASVKLNSKEKEIIENFCQLATQISNELDIITLEVFEVISDTLEEYNPYDMPKVLKFALKP